MAAWQGPIIGRDVETGAWVHLDDRHRNGGFYILGNTRSGKSTLMLNLMIDDMNMGGGFALLDPKGSLVENVLHYVPKDRVKDVILLDFSDPHYSVGLNLYDCPPGDLDRQDLIASQAVGIFKKAWQNISWGPQLEDLLRTCTYTLIENPGMTMAELPRLLDDDAFRAMLLKNVTNDAVKLFWEHEYNGLRDNQQVQLYASTINKVRPFLENSRLRHIVGQAKSTIDMASIMAKQQILLVKLPMGTLGDEVVALVGSMLVELLYQAAAARGQLPASQRHPFGLYADEFQRFATPDFAKLLAEVPEYQVCCVVAHQFRGQFEDGKDPNRGATLNVANKAFFTISGADGLEIAPEIRGIPPGTPASGQRPKFTVHAKPVEYVLNNGHEDQRVRKLMSQVDEIHNYGRDFLAQRIQECGDQEREARSRDREDEHHAFYRGYALKQAEEIHEKVAYYQKGYERLRQRRDSFNAYFAAVQRGDEPLAVEAMSVIAKDYEYDPGYLREIEQVAQILREHPILANSGEYEPVYDNRDIGTYLANMPPYHAKVKIRQGDEIKEFTIKTGLPEAPDQSENMLLFQRKMIDAAMKGRYIRPVKAIDEEIRARQQPEDPPPSRVTRRPLSPVR